MLHVAMATLLLATLGLNLRLGVGLTQALLVSFLLFALPFLSVAQLSLLHRERVDRTGMYAGSAVTLVVLGPLSASASPPWP
jgi:hypothetical protein